MVKLWLILSGSTRPTLSVTVITIVGWLMIMTTTTMMVPVQRVVADELRLIYGEQQKSDWTNSIESKSVPSCRIQSRVLRKASSLPSIPLTLSSTIVDPTLPA
jgi:hypothetical protein